MTSLPYPASLAAAASRYRPQTEAEGSIRVPDRDRGHYALPLPPVCEYTSHACKDAVHRGPRVEPLLSTCLGLSRGLVAAWLPRIKRTFVVRPLPDPLSQGSTPPEPSYRQ